MNAIQKAIEALQACIDEKSWSIDAAQEAIALLKTVNADQAAPSAQSASAGSEQEFPPLPEPVTIWRGFVDSGFVEHKGFTPAQMREYVLADRANRSAPAAPPNLRELRHRLLSLKLLNIDPISDEKRDAHNQAIDEAIWMLDSVGYVIQSAAAQRADERKDVARFKTCRELCFSESDGGIERVGVMFPYPNGAFKSTEAAFLAAIDLAEKGERHHG